MTSMTENYSKMVHDISQCWYLKDVLDVATNKQRTDGRYPKRIGSTFWQIIVPGIGKSAALFYLYDNKGNRKNGYLQTSIVQGVEITEESDNCDAELRITTLNSIFILTPAEPKRDSDFMEGTNA
jgi:hypothetical protein